VIDQAIRTRLLAVSAVTDLVGSSTAARVHPLQMPQRPTFPCITYQIISGSPLYGLAGVAGVAEIRLQIDCWAQTTETVDGYAKARELAEAVRGALSAYTGTVGTDVIQECSLVNRQVLLDGEAGVFRESLDFEIAYTES
jgi:hypothetical protein